MLFGILNHCLPFQLLLLYANGKCCATKLSKVLRLIIQNVFLSTSFPIRVLRT